jgi:small subunit ribosomal protein S6
MSEVEVAHKVYELAFHVTPNLDEGEAVARAKEIESALTNCGGSVITARELKKTRLSYPLETHRSSYLGVIDFNAPGDTIEKLNTHMKLQEGVIRFLIIQKSEGKGLLMHGDARTKRVHTHTPPVRTAKPKEVSAGEEKQIEKELENVLEKI